MSIRTLLRYSEKLAVVRLGAGSDLPSWAESGTIFSITATADETSVVCRAAGVPRKARSEGPFTPYAVQGPLDFSLTGVLSGLLLPLAEAEVSAFTLSTFDTDWILVPSAQSDRAEEAWRAAGHTIVPPGGTPS